MKGLIQDDHIAMSKYGLYVDGLAGADQRDGKGMVIVSVSGIEEELDVAELPDRTVASGGDSKPVEFEVGVPAHHIIDQDAMEAWYNDARLGVPGYRKAVTLFMYSVSGITIKKFFLDKVFPSKRALPDLSMSNEGEMAVVVWTLRGNQIDDPKNPKTAG